MCSDTADIGPRAGQGTAWVHSARWQGQNVWVLRFPLFSSYKKEEKLKGIADGTGMRVPASQDCFLMICGYGILVGTEKPGMQATSWSSWMFHFCSSSVELSGFSWTLWGAGRAEDKVMFRKKSYFDPGDWEGGCQDQGKVRKLRLLESGNGGRKGCIWSV